jgi:thiosulfate dehydrogenase
MPIRSLLSPLYAVLLLATACGAPEREARAPARTGGESTAATPAGGTAEAVPLVPRTADISQVHELIKDPATSPLPKEPHEAEAVKLGYQIIVDTKTHAGKYVGNDMACGNCHLNAGQRDRALPYVGIAATFPHYRSRSGTLISLEERISDCFQRSMNGTAPPYDSQEMMAVAAYITWLSDGFPIGESPEWRGKNKIADDKLIPIEKLDVARGEQIFTPQCSSCHGADGQGVEIAGVKPGPLWGPGSWNDGAGAARIYTLAGYIRYAMPLTVPGSLSDEDAQHVAAYINSHSRPAYPHKRDDYPNGDVPIDAVYYPQRYAKNPLMR